MGPNVQQDRRQAAALLHKASIKNSRLAQQMERRAANITALTAAQKLKKVFFFYILKRESINSLLFSILSSIACVASSLYFNQKQYIE